MFIDVEYPLIATARLSGMMLDYPKLLENGICGLTEQLEVKLSKNKDNEFLKASLESLKLFSATAIFLSEKTLTQMETLPKEQFERKNQLKKMAANLCTISSEKPQSFPEALQLFWLFALMAGVINYGRW